MTSRFFTFVDLAYPFLLGLLVIIIIIFLKKGKNDLINIHFTVFGFATFERKLRKLSIIRLVLGAVALFFFFLPTLRDYARFFPAHMQMEIFFDDKGTDDALAQFKPDELEGLNISPTWHEEKSEYIASLNKVLEDINHPFRFDAAKGAVRSKGENYLSSRKVEAWGWQRYHIEAGRGSLEHTYEIPGQGIQSISSTFELLETDDNYIDLTLSDIYFGWTKVIKPVYKQKFTLSPKEVIYSHNLIALTKVRFFPYLDISKSVYLAKQKTGDKYIPVGYAIYYPDN